MRILITGVSSGLGKFLHQELGGVGWSRQTSFQEREKIRKLGVDVIIHCAFNSSKDVNSDNLFQYFSDNVLFTNELLKIPHKKFVFISSVDVYPKNSKVHSEEELINLEEVVGVYPITKLLSEVLVKEGSRNFLILRCSSLLGKLSRKNSLIRIIQDESPVLSLDSKSALNYVLHSEVSEFISYAINKDIVGVLNIAASSNIRIGAAAKLLGKKVKFGKYHYDVGKISTRKIKNITRKFNKSSRAVIEEFMKQR